MHTGRRDVLRGLGAMSATGVIGSCAPRDGPNVLFLAVDDLNDWVGVMGGHPQAHTPNIDRLAASGMLFANAHCAAPACNPSRVATLTGLKPSSTGVYENEQPWRPMLPDAVTIPAHFLAAGYRVLGAGKIFHGDYVDRDAWSSFFPRRCQQTPKGPKPLERPASGVKLAGPLDWGVVDADVDEMSDAKVTKWAMRQLAEPAERPIFVALGLVRPHLPWWLPQEYFDLFDPELIELPLILDSDRDDIPERALQLPTYQHDHEKLLEHGLVREAVHAYLAAIAFCDAMVGRVLDALSHSPVADDTIVVLWSDHGWHLGEKLQWRKFTLWEEATRVPLIVRIPGMSPAVCNRAVNLVDVYPTLNELCLLPERPELEGRSLLPLLEDPELAWPGGSLTTWKRGNHSVRTDAWRFTRYSDGSTELYDHSSDPMEWTNLAGEPQYAGVAAQLAAHLPVDDAPDAPEESTYAADVIACRKS